MADGDEQESSLLEQTIALGKTLNELAENDPSGTPSELSARVFAAWLAAAGPGSREPRYFADVAESYPVREYTHQDLRHLFGMLEGYIEVPEDDEEDAPPPPKRTFIGLPIAPASSTDT